jgi:hypothetical protein
LDPNGLGRIDFRSFVNGMTKLYSDSEINDQNGEEFRNRRVIFTIKSPLIRRGINNNNKKNFSLSRHLHLKILNKQ